MVRDDNARTSPQLTLGREVIIAYRDSITAERGDPVFPALVAEILLRIDAARLISSIHVDRGGVRIVADATIIVTWPDLGFGESGTKSG